MSVFRWHNETMNIWTHLLGALFFGYQLALAFHSYWTDGMLQFQFESFKKHGFPQALASEPDLTSIHSIFDSPLGLSVFRSLVSRFNGIWSANFSMQHLGEEVDLRDLYNYLASNVSCLPLF